MEDNDDQKLNKKKNSNDLNHSEEQNLHNISSNNDTRLFHEFENTSFNGTKLIEEYGEPKKKLYSSK